MKVGQDEFVGLRSSSHQWSSALSQLLSWAGIGSHHQKSDGGHKCPAFGCRTGMALKPRDERPVPGLAWTLSNDQVGRGS